jgi:hypothetical protein
MPAIPNLISGYFSVMKYYSPGKYASAYLNQIRSKAGYIYPANSYLWFKKYDHSELNKDTPDSLEGSLFVKSQRLHDWAKTFAVKTLTERLETFKLKAPCIWAYIKNE